MVEDRDVGVRQQELGRLFERYFRGSNVQAIVGTGVGLFLVKTVVDLHGGEIAVESREGKGSRFTVRLPMAPPRRADAEVPVCPRTGIPDDAGEDVALTPEENLAAESGTRLPFELGSEPPDTPARSA